MTATRMVLTRLSVVLWLARASCLQLGRRAALDGVVRGSAATLVAVGAPPQARALFGLFEGEKKEVSPEEAAAKAAEAAAKAEAAKRLAEVYLIVGDYQIKGVDGENGLRKVRAIGGTNLASLSGMRDGMPFVRKATRVLRLQGRDGPSLVVDFGTGQFTLGTFDVNSCAALPGDYGEWVLPESARRRRGRSWTTGLRPAAKARVAPVRNEWTLVLPRAVGPASFPRRRRLRNRGAAGAPPPASAPFVSWRAASSRPARPSCA